jgi:hypothetical protein
MPDKNCVNERRLKIVPFYFGVVAITFIAIAVFINS